MLEIDWPFRATEALDAGALTSWELRRFYEAVYPGVWVPRGIELSPVQRAQAAWLWSGREGVVAGLSASAMLGTKWIDAGEPAQLLHTNRRPPPGLTLHTERLHPDDVTGTDIVTTTPARTAFDLGRWLPFAQAVQRVDALLAATSVKVVDIETVAQRNPRARGLKQLRRLLPVVDGGAESPYESLTRLALVEAGFPHPHTQIELFDANGHVLARLDMGWPEYHVAVEYDGAQHWLDATQRSWDIDRAAMLDERGWIVIRVSAGLLRDRRFLERVASALRARGCRDAFVPNRWPYSARRP
ncbi:endonuclease domain-containing protein [Mycobacterium sp. BMJ-28]